MYKQDEILAKIKSAVQEEIPDAKVYLFGSRVTGKIHDESDWDILVITSIKVNRELKDSICNKLVPLKGEEYFFIDIKIVNEKDWHESPSYYVLRNSIKDEVVQI
jgi:uncharacterized protein